MRDAPLLTLAMRLFSLILDFLFPRTAFERMLAGYTLPTFLTHTDKTYAATSPIQSLFSYKHPLVRKTIHALKYHGNHDAARLCGEALFELILLDMSEVRGFETRQTLLVPIPLSNKRLKERGYNQVELVTSEIMKHDKNNLLTHTPHALKRIKHLESQTKTRTRKERIAQARHIFIADPLVKGKNIILIDDVVTTGATMKDARRALHAAGASRVRSYTIAH